MGRSVLYSATLLLVSLSACFSPIEESDQSLSTDVLTDGSAYPYPPNPMTQPVPDPQTQPTTQPTTQPVPLPCIDCDLQQRDVIVRELFSLCLSVLPAQAEVDAWVESGLSEAALFDAICTSSPQNPPNEEELRWTIIDAYAGCLGRAASEEEIQGWLDGGLSAEETFAAICNSEEARRKEIADAYLSYLGRAATVQEIQGWLDTGRTRVEILRAIQASAEARRYSRVRASYRECLGREASEEEARGWINTALTDDEVQAAICGSLEARRRIVDAAYRECLDRVGSDAEIQGWANGNTPLNELRNSICNSAEGAPRVFIKNAYQDCLGRAASPQEVDNWIATGGTPDAIRQGICQSAEARRHAIANAYRECLGRAARPDEIDHWANQAGSHEDLRNGICGSQEARRYAIKLAYRNCLRRWPSEEEVNAWDNTGLSRWEIRWGICNSTEARQYSPVVISHLQTDPNWFYDIYSNNCHTAANLGVLNSPNNTGIIMCQSNYTGVGITGNGVGGHTFNYVSNLDGSTTYWGWGESCGPCAGAPPANYSQPGCHRNCVDKLCLGQFTVEHTHPLPVGQLVEVPGPSFCARQAFYGGGNNASCHACCDQRADAWNHTLDPLGVQQQQRENYRQSCHQLCNGFFQ